MSIFSMNEVWTWMYSAIPIRAKEAMNWKPTRQFLSIFPRGDMENEPFSTRAGWKEVPYIAGKIPAIREVQTAVAAPSRSIGRLSAGSNEPEIYPLNEVPEIRCRASTLSP